MSCAEHALVRLICVHAPHVAETHPCVQHTATVTRTDRSAPVAERVHRSQLRKHTFGAASADSSPRSATANLRAIAT